MAEDLDPVDKTAAAAVTAAAVETAGDINYKILFYKLRTADLFCCFLLVHLL